MSTVSFEPAGLVSSLSGRNSNTSLVSEAILHIRLLGIHQSCIAAQSALYTADVAVALLVTVSLHVSCRCLAIRCRAGHLGSLEEASNVLR